MASRVALLGAMGSYEGPWMKATGAESSVAVSGLGEGESVAVECDEDACILSANGAYPFPKPHCSRYRVVKRGLGKSPTTVRVLL